MNKSIHVIVILMIVACVFGEDSQNIDECLSPGVNPKLEYSQKRIAEAVFLHVQEETIRVPESGFTDSEIVCISVINLDTEADGGYPTILAGGVGKNYVEIHLKSRLSKGYDFQVSVYSKHVILKSQN